MDTEAMTTGGDYPPDLKETDSEARISVTPAGLLDKLSRARAVFHDTFFSVTREFPMRTASEYPYSEITDTRYKERGAAWDLLFIMQDGRKVKLAGVPRDTAAKIRALIGK
jgi:hypothetical protein